MSEVNVEAGLGQLSACLREIQSLVSWAELIEAETRPDTPPSFRIDHHTAEDLRMQAGLFFKIAMDLHEVLNRQGQECGSGADRARWKKKLLDLEERIRKLRLTDRLIKA